MRGGASIFDEITKDDLIVAFYPCIYFSCLSQMSFFMSCVNYRKLDDIQKIEKILERSALREEFYSRLIRLVGVCLRGGLRLIFENPWSMQTYLRTNFLKNPDIVDENRRLRGDYYIKPTAYWFWNCKPTYGESFQCDKEQKIVLKCKWSGQAGLCSEERSMISPDYARNFICDFIIGKKQLDINPQLEFDF